MNIALITGASSGLGREFARQVSRDPHVQAVWAVARREDRLRQLASLCACPVRPVPLDLTDPQSLDALRDLLAREKPTVTRLVCAAGVGKTSYWLYPCLEYALASGMSFLSTDTKGDVVRNYGRIAQECYGYRVGVIDLRNPTRSDGFNLLHLVNKYMDSYW